jgi:glycosyltransferase involved in cell wall biosynthesis
VIDHCGSVRPARFIEDFNNRRCEARMFDHARTVTVSDFVKQQMIRSGYDASRIDSLLLPAPHRETAPTALPRQPRFVFLGRLVPQKGCDWLIRSLAVADAKLELDIAGEGPMRQQLQSLALRLGVQDRVRFLGWLNELAVNGLVDGSRAVVFPSLWPEPAGLITLESAAAGRAAIVSDIGGIPEYARACGHAILVKPGDVNALATAMSKLAHHGALAEQLGAAGRAQAEAIFSMLQHLESLQNLYHQTIESFAHAP